MTVLSLRYLVYDNVQEFGDKNITHMGKNGTVLMDLWPPVEENNLKGVTFVIEKKIKVSLYKKYTLTNVLCIPFVKFVFPLLLI